MYFPLLRFLKVGLLALLFLSQFLVGTAAEATPPDADSDEDSVLPPTKLPGVEVARGTGGFIVVYIDKGKLQVRFTNPKHRLIPPPVSSILARYHISGKVGEERNVLLPNADNTALVGPAFIRSPNNLRLRLTFDAPEGQRPEEFVVIYSVE